jgi:hypothetical protein
MVTGADGKRASEKCKNLPDEITTKIVNINIIYKGFDNVACSPLKCICKCNNTGYINTLLIFRRFTDPFRCVQNVSQKQ